MTELELYKFIENNNVEIDWRGEQLVIWLHHMDLKDFCELIGSNFFDYLGKCLYRDKDTSDIGLKLESVAFHKDRYKDSIPMELRQEIYTKLNNVFEDISDLLSIKR